MFYPEIKAHMSPSALDNWINNRSTFIKSYFEGVRTPETSWMKGGTQIHALIEAGIIKAQHVFDVNEEPISVFVAERKDRVFYGIPDSCLSKAMIVDDATRASAFVDYKTGKSNGWVEKLPTDIKMKATAWLVWNATGYPDKVFAHIEFFQTEWHPGQREVVPMPHKESEVVSHCYSANELKAFTKVILTAMDEVNAEYEKWQESTSDFVSEEDMHEYAALKEQKDEIEMKMKEIGERILDQMQFGSKSTLSTPLGSFYTIERKTYEYPEDLTIDIDGEIRGIKYAEQVEAAAKVAKKNYELESEPKTATKSLGFRAAKK